MSKFIKVYDATMATRERLIPVDNIAEILEHSDGRAIIMLKTIESTSKNENGGYDYSYKEILCLETFLGIYRRLILQ